MYEGNKISSCDNEEKQKEKKLEKIVEKKT